jgi:hypothetical protein
LICRNIAGQPAKSAKVLPERRPHSLQGAHTAAVKVRVPTQLFNGFNARSATASAVKIDPVASTP